MPPRYTDYIDNWPSVLNSHPYQLHIFFWLLFLSSQWGTWPSSTGLQSEMQRGLDHIQGLQNWMIPWKQPVYDCDHFFFPHIGCNKRQQQQMNEKYPKLWIRLKSDYSLPAVWPYKSHVISMPQFPCLSSAGDCPHKLTSQRCERTPHCIC